MKSLTQIIHSEFKQRFKGDPLIIRSPGRVNLIGEHTDYNDGFVLPAAINKVIILAMTPNSLNEIRLHAVDMEPGSLQVSINNNLNKSDMHWPNYILGVVDQLLKAGKKIGGFDCVFGGDIPIGAGLSSSAALEGGITYGLSNLFDLKLSLKEMAKLGQKAENDFVGVQCGIMDQFANLFGRENHAIKLDCRSLDYELYPFEQKNTRIVLCDTKIRRELSESAYNERRGQCEASVMLLNKINPSIKSLRDVSQIFLQSHEGCFDTVTYKRCKYVVEENQRVQLACEDLLNQDLISFGKRMYQSHYGLRDQYEVSCWELDELVDATENLDGVLGARMMGGGFGGCTINLVVEAQLESTMQIIRNIYKEKTGKSIEIYTAKIGTGTSTMSRLKESAIWE